MKRQKRRMAMAIMVGMLLGVPAAFAQGPPRHHGPGDDFMGPRGMNGRKVVTGAPYTATAVSQSAQTLTDGNRIVHSTTATVYRDSQGRTRREETMNGFGPGSSASGPHQVIFISDPVAGFNYVLDPTAHTARKMAIRSWHEKGAGTGSGSGSDTTSASTSRHAARGSLDSVDSNVTTETLGKQTLAGVDADGTRKTFTINAGQAGNDLPIKIVSEKWVSSDLQVVVMSKFSDPRHGDTTYQLTNINRGEPAQSLFQVPADYTVQEGAPPRFGAGGRAKPAASN
jgi:hypothetical protein